MPKRILTMVISILILFSGIPAATQETWVQEDSYGMQFQPADGYISMQNSPCFKWPYSGDKYDLKIYSDESMNKEIESVMGLRQNLFTFDHKLPSGINLYWRVRYWKNGTVSPWSELRKFRIDPNAYTYTLPNYEGMLAKVPLSHPRIWATKDTLAERRNYKNINDRSKEIFDYFYAKARSYTDKDEYMEDPKAPTSYDDYATQGQATLNIRLKTNAFREEIKICGFIYMLTGERDIGMHAAKGIVKMSSWNTSGATSYYFDDMNCVWIALTIGMVYDWVCDLLTESEKQIVFTSIRNRMAQCGFLLDSLYTTPLDSHGWTAIGYLGIMALGLYGDMPEAGEWLNKCMYNFANIVAPWSYQDGGWSNGTYYWSASMEEVFQFIDVMHLSGVFSLYDTAWLSQLSKYYIYAYPKGSRGSFGDDSNNSYLRDIIAYYNYRLAANSGDSAAKWYVSQYDTQYDMVDYFYAPGFDKISTADPEKLPQANHFRDIGWVAMHSNIADENRVMMTFVSTPYGTYNHIECNQNAFIIEGFGENLAIKSGYYDSYHSRHNSGFTRKTYAHNSITINGGKGQLDDNIDADGKITSFITGPEFDTCTGDAAASYFGRLAKFNRTMIYLRPDQFIVIDDLEAGKKGQEVSFEWWLNAEKDIRIYDDGSGAKITSGNAVLDAKIHYPENCRPYYTDLFSGPDLIHVPATGSYASANIDKRIWFETPKAHNTKIIATMDVHTKDNLTKNVSREQFDDYLKLTFENGTIALINLTDDNRRITTKDKISFEGEAVIYSDNSIMLTNGREIVLNGKTIFQSEKTASFSLGLNELSISSEQDNNINVNLCNEYGNCVKRITDFNGRELSSAIGVETEGIKNGEISMKIDHGDYRMKFEKNDVTVGYAGKAEIEVVIDDETHIYELNAYKQANGTINAMGKVEIPAAKYTVSEKNSELNFGGMENNTSKNLNIVYVSTSSKKGNHIKLVKRQALSLVGEQIDDYNLIKSTADAFCEAENYSSMKTGYKYSNNMVSGGYAITQLNGLDAEAKYSFDIKEAGNYDIYVKYVSWESGGLGIRNFNIGNQTYTVELPYTLSWGISPDHWKVVKIPSSVYLEKGENTMTVDATSGMWNYDWIALKKSN